MNSKNKKLLFNISKKELFWFFGFYLFFALFYYVTLWINRSGFKNPKDSILNLVSFFDDAGLQYSIKFMLTAPIWYLLFVRLKDWSLIKKLLLHVLLLPVFVFIFLKSFYFVSEFLGFGHLRGTGSVWDIYIPTLFYILQFGIMHSYNYYLDNQRKIKLEAELKQVALKSELSALKAQLNPHFLYNIFNTISASVSPKQEKTRKMIAELSDLFRYQLKASKEETVALKEELEFIKKYLQLEKERFEDRLVINIDVKPEILDEKVPPMLLQPLIENSIKHGLSTLIDGGKIDIKITKNQGKLHFEIADTGVGIQDKTKIFNKGIGLTNTKLRLEKMFNSELLISDNQPKGLKIEFAI